jgi:ABC-2 type transport system permease protein
VSIAREKEKGTMEVLLVSPVRPIVIIVAKAVPYMFLAILILAAILSMSYFVLDVPLTGSLFWIAVISLIYILLSLSLGLLISNVAKSQLVALLFSVRSCSYPPSCSRACSSPSRAAHHPASHLQHHTCPMVYRRHAQAHDHGHQFPYVVKETAVLVGKTVVLLAFSLLKFKNRLE